MFDDRELTEARIRRFSQDHLAPAISRETAPVTITAYRVPGEPIPPREAITEQAPQYVPIEVGAPLGRAWSTTWLHVTGTVPAHWADDGTSAPELIVNLSFTGQPGFQAEALVFTPDGVTVKAINPFNQLSHRSAPARSSTTTSNARRTRRPRRLDLHAHPLGDSATTGEELYTITRAPAGLAHRRSGSSPRTWCPRRAHAPCRSRPSGASRSMAALTAACDTADPDDLHGHPRAAREVLRPVLESPGARLRADRGRDRPRAHRFGLAVAGAGDPASARARSPMCAHCWRCEHLTFSSPPLSSSSWLRTVPRSCRSASAACRRRPLRAGGRHVGRVGHQHAGIRGAWPASSSPARSSSSRSSGSRPRRPGCRTPSATRPRCRRSLRSPATTSS